MDREDALRQVKLFARLSPRQIARLGGIAAPHTFPAGTRILHRGDTGVALYIIRSGRVSISLRSDESGTDFVLEELGPGDTFGELELIDEGPRSVDVTAVADTECLLLTRWDFHGELREDPHIAVALLPLLCERVRLLEDDLYKYVLEQKRMAAPEG